MVNVNVEPSIISWAYYRSNKAEALEKRFPKLDEWMTGKTSPTLKQLEAYAKATATPLGYFFLKQPPVENLSMPHYRTINDDSPEGHSPELIDTIHIMQRRQDFMRDYLDEQIGEELSFVSSYNGTSELELAERMKSVLNVAQDWASKISKWEDALKHLIYQCEKDYITVMVNGIVGTNTHRKLNVEEFRGFVLVDNIAPLIFINGSDAKAAQIFTLVHEVAHLLLGSSAIVAASPVNKADGKVEKLCNAAAVEFLCPSERFHDIWYQSKVEINRFDALARYFKVSQIVIARRALDLKLINRESFLEFYNDYRERQVKERTNNQSGGNFYATTKSRLGNLFTRAVIYKTQNKAIQYTDAYRLTGLKGNTYQKYVEYFERRGD